MSKWAREFCFALCALAACRLCAQGDAVLTVVESNLYPEPRETAAAVAVAPAHEAVILTGRREGAWIEVRVPGSVSTWIYGDLLRDGEVLAPKVLLRTGPGLSHPGVHEVVRGDRLRVLGAEGDWVRVSPPPQASLWMQASAVGRDGVPSPAQTVVPPPPVSPPVHAVPPTVSEAPARRLPPASPPVEARPLPPAQAGSLIPSDPAGQRVTARPVVVPAMPPAASLTPPPAPAVPVRRLAPRPERSTAQGMATFSGVLRPAGVLGTPGKARLRLVRHDSLGQALTVCYVRGDDAELERLIGEDIAVTGTLQQLPGARHPLIDVDRVTQGTQVRP